jgi:hypothetical protein
MIDINKFFLIPRSAFVPFVRTLQYRTVKTCCCSLQLSKSFSLGNGFSMDSHSLFYGKRWISEQLSLCYMSVSLFSCNVLRLSRASNCDKSVRS